MSNDIRLLRYPASSSTLSRGDPSRLYPSHDRSHRDGLDHAESAGLFPARASVRAPLPVAPLVRQKSPHLPGWDLQPSQTDPEWLETTTRRLFLACGARAG